MTLPAAPDALEPRLAYVTCLSPAGLHRMAYWEWGDPDNDKVLICVHGLTRSGRDFDRLARRMSGTYRVVCPDIVGRGRSDWLSDPAYYVVPQYVSDMLPLLAAVGGKTVHWFGTSLGGLIGMSLAGLTGTPITRIVLNDVGPRLAADALLRIGQYVGRAGEFESQDAGLKYLGVVSAAFGPHSPEDWRELNRHILVQVDRTSAGGQVDVTSAQALDMKTIDTTPPHTQAADATAPATTPWRLHYDPAISVAFKPMAPTVAVAAEMMLWKAFTSIACPILVVRGEQSDLLSASTAAEMASRNPHAQVVEIAGVGHAPTFMSADQIDIAEQFLTGAEG